ncbi:hypothetical protein WJX73_008068 [Symbiochloris irregularis]|uniref:Desiccation-related protein PCC13-62 n=1 Tax=Symbiochloris irregularis TaxID=706552 RepID=A0AAW1PS32_9CHLO
MFVTQNYLSSKVERPPGSIFKEPALYQVVLVDLRVPSTKACRPRSPADDHKHPHDSLLTEVLNYALNLEYLEGEFYSCAATGQPLPSDLRGGGPASTGCRKAKLNNRTQAIAEELADNEIAHVTLLRHVLGHAAVPIPRLNIGLAFGKAADLAVGETLRPAFSPYSGSLSFLHGAFIFEDVVRIALVEGYQSGIIRDELYHSIDKVVHANFTVADLVDAIATHRATHHAKAGDHSLHEGLEQDDGTLTLVPVTKQGLVHTRTPAEVIVIVTLGAKDRKGGFFPEGLNGKFGSVASSIKEERKKKKEERRKDEKDKKAKHDD